MFRVDQCIICFLSFMFSSQVFVPKGIIIPQGYILKRMYFDPPTSPSYTPCIELLNASGRRPVYLIVYPKTCLGQKFFINRLEQYKFQVFLTSQHKRKGFTTTSSRGVNYITSSSTTSLRTSRDVEVRVLISCSI